VKKLKIKCTSRDCASDLHCYLPTPKMIRESKAGECRECGADLVDWKRIQTRNLRDHTYTERCLKTELVRHYWWHIPFTLKVQKYVDRFGVEKIVKRITSRIRSSVGKAANDWDGQQTPREKHGQIIHFAQHATATCCRKCVNYWHGIEKDRALTEAEIEYLSGLIEIYVRTRIDESEQK